MRSIFLLTGFFFFFSIYAEAQVPLNKNGMNFVPLVKPNNIIYRDTLYRGVKEFSGLFYRSGNPELLMYLDKHQSNKIAGQVIGILGTFATVFGVGYLSDDKQKGLAWGLIGGGFAATLTGGYLLLKGQQNLQMAVSLFNQKNNRAALGIGVGEKTSGLVYRF